MKTNALRLCRSWVRDYEQSAIISRLMGEHEKASRQEAEAEFWRKNFVAEVRASPEASGLRHAVATCS